MTTRITGITGHRKVALRFVLISALIKFGVAVADEAGPKLRPGDLPLDTARLEPMNLIMQWTSFGEDGEPTSVTPLLVEYEEFIHEWKPTGQIRWLTIGGDSPAYDMMLVDLESFRIKVRHEPLPDKGISVRTWMEGRATGGALHPDGSVTTWVHETDNPFFDIATFPFLFAAVRWDYVPEHFQISMPQYESGTVTNAETQWYEVEDGGMTTFVAADGDEHRVRRVSILNWGDDRRIDYYVSPEPPFWIGMVPHASEGGPTSTARAGKFELRTVTLSEYVENWMSKRPEQ